MAVPHQTLHCGRNRRRDHVRPVQNKREGRSTKIRDAEMMRDGVGCLRRLFVALCIMVCLGATAATAFAQAPAAGTLHLTVVDQSGAVIPGATVTVAGADDATKAAAIAPVQTSEGGVAVVSALRPGRYTIQAAFPGFEPRLLDAVRVRAGENKQVAVLAIERVEASLTVEQDRQQAAADRQGPSFGTSLTRDQIEALS